MTQIRMAQYGTKHGHAAGKLRALQNNPHVDVVGLFEPDQDRRQAVSGTTPYQDVHWFESEEAMLSDESIVAIASEGGNHESLDQTEAIIQAGKHVWYDKPAGDNWAQWQRVVALADEKNLLIQLGYMFRYHDGFRLIAEWAKSGMLGQIFSIRSHMSTSVPEASRQHILQHHQGGIFFDLAGHTLDQIVWILGRPDKITAFFRHDDDIVPGFPDNNLAVFEFERAMALIEIAAMEPKPMARRYEVYGTKGSAVMEPMEPATQIRLCLTEAQGGYQTGEQMVPLNVQSRQDLYEAALESFLATITEQQGPDRSRTHEVLVQETLLRAIGYIS